MATTAGTITMSMREADRLKTIQAVVDRMLGVGQAALRLGISTRQVGRLLARYRAEGPMGLVSRRRGLSSNHQLEPGLAERAVRLIRDRYADFGPTLAREKLAECHALELAKETVRHLMMGSRTFRADWCALPASPVSARVPGRHPYFRMTARRR